MMSLGSCPGKTKAVPMPEPEDLPEYNAQETSSDLRGCSIFVSINDFIAVS